MVARISLIATTVFALKTFCACAQIVAFPVGHFAESGGVGPAGTTHYFEVTIQSSQVDVTLTDFPVYVDLSDAPAGFWSQVSAGGANIRVYNMSVSVEMPREIVHIDTAGGNTGELHFEANSINSATDTTFRVYYGGGASAPAATDSNGRNAVWANNFGAVYHLAEADPGADTIVNSEGTSALNLTDVGSMTTGDAVAGQFGATGEPSAFQFDGSDDGLQTAAAAFTGAPAAISAITTFDDDGAVQDPVGAVRETASSNNFFTLTGRDSIDKVQASVSDSGGAVVAVSSAITRDTDFHHWAADFSSATDHELFLDGVSAATQMTSRTPTSLDATNVGFFNFGAPRHSSSTIDEVRFHTTDRSDAWWKAEHSNLLTPASFYTIGSEVEL